MLLINQRAVAPINAGTKPDILNPGTILATPTTGFESQGCFFNSAPHPIGQESPIEINGEIIIRNLGIQIVDQIPIYI